MSIFDWQADAEAQAPSSAAGGTVVVSPYFGIYWLVSLPLTVGVLLTWRAWWHREKSRYQLKYPHVKLDSGLDSGIGSGISDRLTGMFRKRKQSTDIEMLE